MNLRERCQSLFKVGYQYGKTSFRNLAEKTQISKSSVHRLYHRIKNRNRHPESQFWETEAGHNWLKLLIVASIFIFGLQGGIGCERLSQFFRLLRLDKHIGVSPTAIRTIRSKIESTIIQYQKIAQKSIQKKASGVEVCLAADETFFDQVILVMLDLPSGYIFVEDIAKNCQYSTWQQQLKSNLKGLNLKIKYLVSDRAKAIVKLALNDLGTNSIADLFHVLYNLNRSIGFEINCLITRYNKQIESAEKERTRWGTIAELKTQQERIQQSRLIFENCCYQITTCLHPIDINENSIQAS